MNTPIRRQVIVYVSPDRIYDLFQICSIETTRAYAYAIRFAPPLPADAKLVSVHAEWNRRMIAMTVEHPSFAEVQDGAPTPEHAVLAEFVLIPVPLRMLETAYSVILDVETKEASDWVMEYSKYRELAKTNNNALDLQALAAAAKSTGSRVHTYTVGVESPVIPDAPEGPQQTEYVGHSTVIHVGAANEATLLATLLEVHRRDRL